MVLRNARSRVRKILLSCHSRHVLDTGLNTKFGDYLASELTVTADAEQLSGKSHWWTPSSLSREQSSTLAVPAAALSGPQTVDVVPGPAAPSARATWAFNRHMGGPHTCADGCRHPVASSSGAFPDHTGPPSFSPGVESLPYGLLGSGIRDSNWAAAVAAATVPNPAMNVAGPPAAAPRQAADLLRRTGGGGSGLRHLAPAMPAIAPALPAVTVAAAKVPNPAEHAAGGGSGLHAPAMRPAMIAPAIPAVTSAAATDPSPATPPRAGALGRSRQLSTPPKDPAAASESPA